jgi:hypothetical protein
MGHRPVLVAAADHCASTAIPAVANGAGHPVHKGLETTRESLACCSASGLDAAAHSLTACDFQNSRHPVGSLSQSYSQPQLHVRPSFLNKKIKYIYI